MPGVCGWTCTSRDETDRVYSIEMQMADTRELPRRSRYYQGMIDLQLLEKGLTYRYLNDTYIIFICPFDLYETGRHRYTFAGACAEDPEVTIQDGAVRIFLNAKGTMNDVSSSLKAFLDYVAGTVTEDPFVQELEEAVTEARKNRKWRHEYMTLLIRDQDNLEKGREEGLKLGREEGLKEGLRRMIEALKECGIPQEEIRKKVQEKYQLTEEELGRYLD